MTISRCVNNIFFARTPTPAAFCMRLFFKHKCAIFVDFQAFIADVFFPNVFIGLMSTFLPHWILEKQTQSKMAELKLFLIRFSYQKRIGRKFFQWPFAPYKTGRNLITTSRLVLRLFFYLLLEIFLELGNAYVCVSIS